MKINPEFKWLLPTHAFLCFLAKVYFSMSFYICLTYMVVIMRCHVSHQTCYVQTRHTISSRNKLNWTSSYATFRFSLTFLPRKHRWQQSPNFWTSRWHISLKHVKFQLPHFFFVKTVNGKGKTPHLNMFQKESFTRCDKCEERKSRHRPTCSLTDSNFNRLDHRFDHWWYFFMCMPC